MLKIDIEIVGVSNSLKTARSQCPAIMTRNPAKLIVHALEASIQCHMGQADRCMVEAGRKTAIVDAAVDHRSDARSSLNSELEDRVISLGDLPVHRFPHDDPATGALVKRDRQGTLHSIADLAECREVWMAGHGGD